MYFAALPEHLEKVLAKALEDVRIDILGDTAIAFFRSHSRVKLRARAALHEPTSRVGMVFQRTTAGWRVIHFHESALSRSGRAGDVIARLIRERNCAINDSDLQRIENDLGTSSCKNTDEGLDACAAFQLCAFTGVDFSHLFNGPVSFEREPLRDWLHQAEILGVGHIAHGASSSSNITATLALPSCSTFGRNGLPDDVLYWARSRDCNIQQPHNQWVGH
jgi:hypothetical protein